MILTDVLREIFQATDSLSLSYGPFLLFITVFIAFTAGTFALANFILNRFLNR
jgi:hypothetical protein